MSDSARRLLVLRYWVEYMEALPASSYSDRELFVTVPKLRDAADFVIQWGC